MSEPSAFLLELGTTLKYRGQNHTITSALEPVFTGDEDFALNEALASHARALKTLTGYTNEGKQLMAKIEIESAFVEPWTKNEEQHPAWGMKTAEPHSRKKDGGGYETVGRTFRTIKVSRASSIDLTQFRKGDRVQVWGKEVTETREHDGKKYYDLVLWADRVERASGGTAGSQAAPQPAAGERWATSATPPAADTWNVAPEFSGDVPF